MTTSRWGLVIRVVIAIAVAIVVDAVGHSTEAPGDRIAPSSELQAPPPTPPSGAPPGDVIQRLPTRG